MKKLNYMQLWERNHFKKIIRELKEKNIELIVENIPLIIHETSFKVRRKKFRYKDLNECPYYNSEDSNTSSCHPEIKDLNCLLCPCPNYDSTRLEGGCKINSKHGKWYYHVNLPLKKIWDCSDCHINHSPIEIENWLKKEGLEFLKKINNEIYKI